MIDSVFVCWLVVVLKDLILVAEISNDRMSNRELTAVSAPCDTTHK